MTDKENRTRQCELAWRTAHIALREARSNLEHGYAKLKADMEREYLKLKLDVERAEIIAQSAESDLDTAKAELARGYTA
jgi:hypothetical protein